MKRIIQWQSQHLEIDPISGKLKEYAEESEENMYDDSDYPEDMERQPIQNVMSTPFGYWRIDDSMNPYKQFKLWMAHTNFSITEDIMDRLTDIPGVEVLQIMTRYRFIVGVGELFDIRDVRTTIEDSLQCNKDEDVMIADEKLLQQIHDLRQQLSVYHQWAIYVFPHGEIDFTTSEEADFGRQLNIYKQAVDHSNGVLIESKNE